MNNLLFTSNNLGFYLSDISANIDDVFIDKSIEKIKVIWDKRLI